MSNLLVYVFLTLILIFSMAVIAYTTIGVEKAPEFLRPLLRHVGKMLDAMEQAMEEEHKFQLEQQQQLPFFKRETPELDSARAFQKTSTPKVQTQPSLGEARFFQLQEMALGCRFEPRIKNAELLVTRGELARLKDYCALAFDKPLTVEEFLKPLGLVIKKARSRR